MLTPYDKANIEKILLGEGDWFSAHTLRFLDKVIWNADSINLIRLWKAFPEYCEALYKHYGWTESKIELRLILAGVENAIAHT